MEKIHRIIKKDPVLMISGLLAVISAFFIPPDAAYLSYIDFRVLALLYCLMCVMNGFQEIGLFQKLAVFILSRTKNTRQLTAVLVFLCFFLSMFITNDVSLITFVPFTVLILTIIGQTKLMIYVIVLQTIAANLGSMATPIGNPQNLYLYSHYQLSLPSFFQTTFPLALASFLLLALFLFREPSKALSALSRPCTGAGGPCPKSQLALYCTLFAVCLAAVARLIPVALALRGGGRFTGHGRLMERPQEPYFAIFREKGISYEQGNGTLTVEGRLTPGTYTLPGDVSSQFITGLLYALPLLEGDSELVLTTALESRGYVDMTLDALAQFGVSAEYDGNRRFRVPGNQAYRHRDLAIEGDWSNAAFWFAAAFLGHRVDVEGLNPRSVQGDRVIGEQLARLTQPGPAELDVSQCPDLVPPLAAMAALRAGETTAIVNAARLRIKESDRLASVTQVLNALGAGVEEHADHLVLRGRERLAGGVTVSGHNDHRIAMMAAIAATRCQGPVTITGAECVNKSYPRFWADYEALGGQIART